MAAALVSINKILAISRYENKGSVFVRYRVTFLDDLSWYYGSSMVSWYHGIMYDGLVRVDELSSVYHYTRLHMPSSFLLHALQNPGSDICINVSHKGSILTIKCDFLSGLISHVCSK